MEATIFRKAMTTEIQRQQASAEAKHKICERKNLFSLSSECFSCMLESSIILENLSFLLAKSNKELEEAEVGDLRESDLSYANTIIICENGNRETWQVGEYLAVNIEECEELESSTLLDNIGLNIYYKKTDLWRGHYDAIPLQDSDLVKVIDDWYGTLDDHNIIGRLGAFHELWSEKKINPLFKMIVCLLTTSNVCAGGIEVYVERKHTEDFETWLKQSEHYEEDPDLPKM